MSRQYFDRVEVIAQRSQDVEIPMPETFLWRQRRYRVTAILARWIEAEAWWKGAMERTDRQQSALDKVVWRVEAKTRSNVGVFDLCQQVGKQQGNDQLCEWFLVRTFD